MASITLSEIRDLLSCDLFTGEEQLQTEFEFGCASDLMSDVLAFSQPGALLLTGLVNRQTIQTADIAEISAVVFVRGKQPDSKVIALATERKIPLLATPYSMFEASGILYRRGLRPTMIRKKTSFGPYIVTKGVNG
jgi:predicted transcriptional regulator